MKRSSVLGVIGATAVLIGAGTSIASAATGTFSYKTDYESKTLMNPPSGECIDVGVDPADFADNGTDRAVTLFTDKDCMDAREVVPPGERYNTAFMSVKFD